MLQSTGSKLKYIELDSRCRQHQLLRCQWRPLKHIGSSAQRSSCGLARVGGEKWGVRFHVFPKSDGSHLKWDTPHINQPINQGFLGPGMGYGVVEAQVRVAAHARCAWHPASASAGIFPPAASAATSGAGTDWSAYWLSSNDSRLMAQLGSQHRCSSTSSQGLISSNLICFYPCVQPGQTRKNIFAGHKVTIFRIRAFDAPPAFRPDVSFV